MDVNLPGISGHDATRKILEESDDRIVVLLLSTKVPDGFDAIGQTPGHVRDSLGIGMPLALSSRVGHRTIG